jgi:hypothetical protein
MVTYANAVQPLDRLFDGFLIHSRGAAGAPISQAPQAAPPMPALAGIWTDIGVPVLTVETHRHPRQRARLPAGDLAQLNRWVRTGIPAPHAARVRFTSRVAPPRLAHVS